MYEWMNGRNYFLKHTKSIAISTGDHDGIDNKAILKLEILLTYFVNYLI